MAPRDAAREFGARLKQARRRARLKRLALARRAELSEVYLGRLERGERLPRWEVVLRLARALGVPLCVLGGPRHPADATGEATSECKSSSAENCLPEQTAADAQTARADRPAS